MTHLQNANLWWLAAAVWWDLFHLPYYRWRLLRRVRFLYETVRCALRAVVWEWRYYMQPAC